MSTEVEEFIEHYGVKGMKWGVLNGDRPGNRLQAGPTIDAKLHPSTKSGATEVAALMSARYGFRITEIKDLKSSHPEEYARGTVGFVVNTPGASGGTVYARSGDTRKMLKDAENIGWFAEGTGNVRGFLTHEAAHAMFHAEQKVTVGFFGGTKVSGGNHKARQKAIEASVKEANRNGIPTHLFSSKISGYAEAANMLQETEAELFNQYHWSPKPPTFVKVWGQTLHRELGVDATPFREVVKQ